MLIRGEGRWLTNSDEGAICGDAQRVFRIGGPDERDLNLELAGHDLWSGCCGYTSCEGREDCGDEEGLHFGRRNIRLNVDMMLV